MCFIGLCVVVVSLWLSDYSLSGWFEARCLDVSSLSLLVFHVFLFSQKLFWPLWILYDSIWILGYFFLWIKLHYYCSYHLYLHSSVELIPLAYLELGVLFLTSHCVISASGNHHLVFPWILQISDILRSLLFFIWFILLKCNDVLTGSFTLS